MKKEKEPKLPRFEPIELPEIPMPYVPTVHERIVNLVRDAYALGAILGVEEGMKMKQYTENTEVKKK